MKLYKQEKQDLYNLFAVRKTRYEVEYDLDKMRFWLVQNDNCLSLHSHYVISIWRSYDGAFYIMPMSHFKVLYYQGPIPLCEESIYLP